MRILIATFIGLLLLATSALAQRSEVTEFTLDNGLKVILKENHNAPVINFNVAYRVGSKYERPGITGISHLLEHLMFKTTNKYPLGHFDEVLQQVGADNNANTWLDRTIYYETIAADQIDTALELESDRMYNLSFIEEDHRLEMPVVRNELEQRNDSPFSLLYEELLANAFKAHPYGIPTIGWVDDVEGILTSDIEEYYKRWYHPDNAFIVAVGDFETEELRAKIEQYFGPIPSGNVVHPRLPQEPKQLGERRFILKRAGQVDYLGIGWQIPESEHPDSFALVVLGNILGSGRTSRLYKALVDTGMAAEAFASSDAFGYADPHLFFAGAVIAPGTEPAAVEQGLYDVVDTIKRDGVTDAELERAKKQARASFVYDRDSIVSEAQALMDFELYSGGWEKLYDYLPGIEAVTTADVQRVAQQYLIEDTRTVGTYLGQPAGGEAAETAPAEPAGFKNVGPAYYRDPEDETRREPAPAGSAEQLALSNNDTPRAEHGLGPYAVAARAGAAPPSASIHQADSTEPYAQVFELSNGLTLVVRENHSNPSVSLSGVVPAGAIDDPAGKPGIANLAVSMLDRGTEQYSKAELAELEEGNAISLGFGAGRESFTFSGRSLAEDFTLLLDLLAAELLTPTFPQEELELLRAETLTVIRENNEDTTARAGRLARELLYGADNPFAQIVEGTEESVTAATREDLQAWYDAHVKPAGTVIAIVGDVDPQQARAAIEQRFAGWQGNVEGHEARVALSDDFNRVGGTVEQVILPDKSNVTLLWAGPGPSKATEDWPVHTVANYILGGDFSARLNKRLRVQEGLTYGSYSYYSNGLANGPFFSIVQVNPENVVRATEVMEEELAKYHAEGPTPEEIEVAKSYITGNFPVRLSTNSAVASTLADSVYLGKGVDYIQRYPELIRAVTMEQVRASIAQYIDPSQLLRIESGTLSAAAAE